MPHDPAGVVLHMRKNTVAGLFLTPWSRIQHEKLIVPHLVEKLPHFIESEGSLPRSHEPPPFFFFFFSWAIRINCTPSLLISSRPILILSTHAYVALVSFHWFSPPNPVCFHRHACFMLCQPYCAPYSEGTGGPFLRGGELTTQFYLVPRQWIHGAVHPLRHMPSWLGALKQDSFAIILRSS